MADRRRINGPAVPTIPPIFDDAVKVIPRSRPGGTLRKRFLKTGITPSASGSAYLEVESAQDGSSPIGGMKIACTVHGPRSLPRSAPFSPHLVLTTYVKYTPFATRQRKGYIRDPSERDLSVHLETALRGVIMTERWPKSGIDVVVTIIEGDQMGLDSGVDGGEEWDMVNTLSGCITVASAALVDAGIDCVDTVAGGAAALVSLAGSPDPVVVLDPESTEHREIMAACCVAYLPSRDEITNLWIKGRIPPGDLTAYSALVNSAIQASRATGSSLSAALGCVI